MPPPNNRKAVWHHPRDSKGDRLLSYIVDARQTGNNEQSPLEPHPLAGSDPNYEGLVFLFREPAGNDGAMAQDWYGPLTLADPVIRVSTAGAGYQSGVLYARGAEPPELDPRIEVRGQETITASFAWWWETDPVTFNVGADLIWLEVDGPEQFNGDEVYIQLSDVGNIPGIEPGLFQIVRHVTSTMVQIAVPYDADVLISTNAIGIAYEACYILDGYSDTESAPGVMANKFHLRSFTYRLATPNVSYQWDESLGIELTQESRPVPATWARNWDVGFTSAAVSDEEASTSYQAVSKLIYNRSKSGITGTPQEDGTIWPGQVRVSVPAICQEITAPWVWALAESDDGGYVSYDEDWGITQKVWGPASVGCLTSTHRKIAKTNDIESTIATYMDVLLGINPVAPPVLSSGVLFSFIPEAYALEIGSWAAHSGDNIWTRAKIRPFSVGPFLLKNNILQFTLPVPSQKPGGGEGGQPAGSTITFTPTVNTPWGQTVLWNQTVTKARWGYWIIDFTLVTLPSDPS